MPTIPPTPGPIWPRLFWTVSDDPGRSESIGTRHLATVLLIELDGPRHRRCSPSPDSGMKASLSFAVLLSRIAVYSASVIACIVATPAPGAESSAPPLFERLGSHHVEITTRSEPAQKYFDQGIRLVYAFNHEEAVRSFEEAARLDPDAPMLHRARPLRWGPISMHQLIDGRKSGRRILFKKPGDCSMSRRVSGRCDALAKVYIEKRSVAR